jgi:hypothetical protein
MFYLYVIDTQKAPEVYSTDTPSTSDLLGKEILKKIPKYMLLQKS